jgi:hypothetical protein
MESLGDTNEPDPPENKPQPKAEVQKSEPVKEVSQTKMPDKIKSNDPSPNKSVKFDEPKKEIPINAISTFKEVKDIKASSFNNLNSQTDVVLCLKI